MGAGSGRQRQRRFSHFFPLILPFSHYIAANFNFALHYEWGVQCAYYARDCAKVQSNNARVQGAGDESE